MTRAIFLAFLVGCSAVPNAPQHRDLTFQVDPRFSLDERMDIALATMTWAQISGDRVHVVLTDAPSEWQFVRMNGDEKIVTDRDKTCHTGTRVAGFYGLHKIYLIPGRLYGDQQLDRLAFHEIGHAIGLPHTPSVHDAMSETFANVDPTPTDINLCRGYHLCP